MYKKSILTGAAILLMGFGSPARTQPETGVSPVTYFKNGEGKFARSIAMAFDATPRIGDEIKAGTNIYRVIRILYVVVDGRSTETRIYFERVGPAEPD